MRCDPFLVLSLIERDYSPCCICYINDVLTCTKASNRSAVFLQYISLCVFSIFPACAFVAACTSFSFQE